MPLAWHTPLGVVTHNIERARRGRWTTQGQPVMVSKNVTEATGRQHLNGPMIR